MAEPAWQGSSGTGDGGSDHEMNLLDLAYIPVAAATAPWWATKRRAGWAERFGKTEALAAPGAGRPRVLLHAVSVGEVAALRHLVPLLAPTMDVVVSATTDTGLKRAGELFARDGGARATVVRYPLDFSASVRRFLDAVRPDVVALVELELWPNFVRECEKRGIPACVVNGRLSERSFAGYRRVRRVIRPTFARLALAAVQDDDYAARFRALGVAPDRVRVTGSMKWDAANIADEVPGAAELAAEMGIDRTRPLVVAGSTAAIDEQACEEGMLHLALPAGVQLLCAPRKPEHFEAAARAMPGCVRRSRTKGAGPRAPERSTSRYLLDTIGELRMAYSLADVVVVGRSFGKLYGSDPIEPVALGKPTVVGPAVDDFVNIVSALEGSGAVVRATVGTIGSVIRQVLDSSRDAAWRAEIARAGRACIRAHQGASERHARVIAGLVRVGRPASAGGPG